MNIHEYQAKAVLREFGVPVPRGIPALQRRRSGKGRQRSRRAGLGGESADPCRRPRQGRRRQGRQIGRRREASEATRLLGSTLVTHQTGPHGKQVHRLYIEEGSAIDKEFYLSMLIDRETSRVAVVVSTEGGMNIEEVAHSTPDKIVDRFGRSGGRHLSAPRAHRGACAGSGRRSGEAAEPAVERISIRPSSTPT